MNDYIIIKKNDNLYPEKLKKIIDPPEKIYAKGNLKLLKEDMMAIVGTRHITSYGKKYVNYFSEEIASRKITIISGMAIRY